MRLSDSGVPVIILGHRKREFLETTVESLRKHATGITDVIVVDDSDDSQHHDWLDDHGFQYTIVDPRGNAGYLMAMRMVWDVARDAVDESGSEYVLLWEEDFRLVKDLDIADMLTVMDADPMLAQLNLQRQAVYRIEKRFGYLQSHQRRGYELRTLETSGIPWVKRRHPFTTNPGLLRREVLDIEWPSRFMADQVPGGAEPAMSVQVEKAGYHFGWLGETNVPHTHHIGSDLKTGNGY